MFYVFEAHGSPDEGDLVTIYGSSSETKPTDVADGSVFVETDTQKVLMWDKANTTWREMGSPAEDAAEEEPAEDEPGEN